MNNYLENQIDKLIKYINSNGLGFGWKNHPNRNFQGTYLSGEPFDYCILTGSKKVCFDAKETIKSTWAIKPKDITQASNLYKVSQAGIEVYFVIYFITEKKLMKIDIDNFLKILMDRKNIKIDDCAIWNYKELIKNG